MAKFIFAYHGGSTPQTPEETAKDMEQWLAWMGKYQDIMSDPGNPVGMSKTVHSGGIDDNGGSNPLAGYSIIEAQTMEKACAIAGECPIVNTGGSVEVAQIHEVEM